MAMTPPPFDPELAAHLEAINDLLPPTITPDMIPSGRQLNSGSSAPPTNEELACDANDLTGLPPAFIDVGSAETFRDEDITYATRIWQAGGIAELHVWPGGFHGFDGLVPQAALSADGRAAVFAGCADCWVSDRGGGVAHRKPARRPLTHRCPKAAQCDGDRWGSEYIHVALAGEWTS